jgi:trans-aconitate methyltransferase
MKNNNNLKSYGWLLSKFYTLMVKFSKNEYIIGEFKNRIDRSKKILELGSGPGNDYKVLVKDYDITGSDYSETFLRILRSKFPEDKFLRINALTVETKEKYDVIYSNKVLHHLTPEHLALSLKRQYETLNDGGILFHTMWKGNIVNIKENSMPDVRYERDGIEKILNSITNKFTIRDFIVYKELKIDDSFIVVMEKN